jgi:diguanylate cyclase (GGDEF)-like protein
MHQAQKQSALIPPKGPAAAASSHAPSARSERIAVLESEVQWLETETRRLQAALDEQALLTAAARAEADLYRREIEEEKARLETLATLDGLTGLGNRRAFEERLAHEFQRAIRYGESLSVIMLDVDRFKQYNDMYGHVAGDTVLKKVADILKQNVRDVDLAARYGGEEFAIVMPANKESAVAVAERLRTIIEQTDLPRAHVTASFGVATMTEQMALYAVCDLVAEADHALYYSKSRCRNRVSHIQDVSVAEAEESSFIAINAGGPAVAKTAFLEDAYFDGGASSSFFDVPIKTDGVSRPGPEAIFYTERYGDFTYRVPNLQPGACFLVRLHFAELHFDAVGIRVFNVLINDLPVLTDFDIVRESGGRDQVIARTFPAIASDTGEIVIEFRSIVDNAKLSGLELVPVRYNNTYAINCGAGTSSPFVRDEHFTGGLFGHPGSGDRHLPFDLSEVTGIVPPDVYRYDRYAEEFAYRIPKLPPATPCLVRLHFAEAYWHEIGERVFNVDINGKRALTNFDIIASAGGRLKAVTRKFPTIVDSDGMVIISFASVIDKAQINAIELFWRE